MCYLSWSISNDEVRLLLYNVILELVSVSNSEVMFLLYNMLLEAVPVSNNNDVLIQTKVHRLHNKYM